MFSTLPKTNFNFSATFDLSSANAFNLDQLKNFLFGNELILSQTSPGFNVSAVQLFWKHYRVFSTLLENFLPFSSDFRIVGCKFFQFGQV